MHQFNKRGQGYKTVVNLIIVLAVGFILFLVVQSWIGIFKDIEDIEPCKLSLLAQASTKIAGQTMLDIECPIHKVIFYKDHVTVGVGDSDRYKEIVYDGKSESSFDELDKSGADTDYDNVVDQTLADEMRKCWYKTGKGELDLFDADLFTGKNVCMICSEFSFADEIKDLYDYQGDLTYYLTTHYLPDNSMTYAAYFKRPIYEKERVIPFIFRFTQVGAKTQLNFTRDINPKENFYLMYVSYLQGITVFGDDMKSLLGFDKSQRAHAGMYIIPANELSNLQCDALVN